MKAAIKAQWVKDLRSGEFEQGTFSLRQRDERGGKDQFCCLGVLCEQAVKAGVIPAPELSRGVYRYLDDRHDDLGSKTGESFHQKDTLPAKVREWAGLDSDNPDIGGQSAAEANDGEELTFTDIADLIDANVPAE